MSEQKQRSKDIIRTANIAESAHPRLKICGLSRPCDIEWVNDAGVDFAGFVFARSRRQVSPEQAKQLHSMLKKEIPAVGVFVNETKENILMYVDRFGLNYVQLHGDESPEYCRTLHSQGIRIIKAFSIKTAEDIEKALQSPADYILLDQGGGGTGKTFDWSLIPEIQRPFFLAGGIGAANLEQAIREIHPYAVDLSSSVETEKWKDPKKIRQVVDIVRRI